MREFEVGYVIPVPMYFEKTFERLTEIPRGEFEACHFKHIQGSESHLSRQSFVGCTFEQCHFNLIQVQETKFQDCLFKDCQLLGVAFEKVYKIGLEIRFEDCWLDHASFVGLPLTKTPFLRCRLTGVDFSGADLREADFSGSSLHQAQFFNTRLEKADFRQAEGFDINPQHNKLKKTKFNISGLPGLLRATGIDIYPG